MHVIIKMKGTTPLLMHNEQLADPNNKFAKAIAVLTAKKTKTEADQLAVQKLEFMGGLYVGKVGVMIPTPNIRKCLRNAAAVRREGKLIERGLITMGIMENRLLYSGPTDLEKLWADETFRRLQSVRIGRGRVQRMRPQFVNWELHSEWQLVPDVLNLAALERIVKEAGVIEGLGDGRVLGNGRFEGSVIAASKGLREAA